MLRVTLIGNMGADPELRYSQKGTQIASFNVAVNQVRRGPDGERQENTEWFRIRVGGPQTDFVQRLTKGTRVLVLGRLDISHYQSRDGEPRTGFDVGRTTSGRCPPASPAAIQTPCWTRTVTPASQPCGALEHGRVESRPSQHQRRPPPRQLPRPIPRRRRRRQPGPRGPPVLVAG